MSGIIIRKVGTGSRPLPELLRRLCFVHWTKSVQDTCSGFEFGLSWIDVAGYTPFFQCPPQDVTIAVMGRIYDSQHGIRLDRRLDVLAEDYRRRGAEALYPFEGAGNLILFDRQASCCFIVTDRLGWMPLYVAHPEQPERTVVCSHPDVLAASCAEPQALDEASLAEHLATRRVLHPYTSYRDVRELSPASVYRWDAAGFRREKSYWMPEMNLDANLKMETLAMELAEITREEVRRREADTPGRKGLLLSGGLDSRAILFALARPQEALSITLCDGPGREAQIAAAMAKAAGAEHPLFQRDPEYYGNMAVNAVRVLGGMCDFGHAHTGGFSAPLHAASPHLLFHAYFADGLFKGYELDRRTRRPLGFMPKRKSFAPFSPDWESEHVALAPPYQRLVEDRLAARYSHLPPDRTTPAGRCLVELARFRPVSRRAGFPFCAMLMRTQATDFLFSDLRTLNCFLKTRPEWKLNRELWIRTIARISPQTMCFPDTNTGMLPTASFLRQCITDISSKIAKCVPGKRTTERSWIDWRSYLQQSAAVKMLWAEVRQVEPELFRSILGYDPFARPLEAWAADPQLFRRILSTGLWLKYRITHG